MTLRFRKFSQLRKGATFLFDGDSETRYKKITLRPSARSNRGINCVATGSMANRGLEFYCEPGRRVLQIVR